MVQDLLKGDLPGFIIVQGLEQSPRLHRSLHIFHLFCPANGILNEGSRDLSGASGRFTSFLRMPFLLPLSEAVTCHVLGIFGAPKLGHRTVASFNGTEMCFVREGVSHAQGSGTFTHCGHRMTPYPVRFVALRSDLF